MRRISQREHRRAIASLHRLADQTMRRVLRQAFAPSIARLRSRHMAMTAAATDDLDGFTDAWVQLIDDELQPMLEEAFGLGGLGAARQLGKKHVAAVADIRDATHRVDVADFVSEARLRWVANTQPAWMKLGDDIWAKAKTELLDGISAGESVDELAERLTGMVDLAGPLADTVARSMAVASANAGSYTEVKALGSDGPGGRVWISTADGRTRIEHEIADGQVVAFDQPFDVGGEALDFPGDPAGSDENVLNCRCAIGYTDEPPEEGAQNLPNIMMELPTGEEAVAASANERQPSCHCLIPSTCECQPDEVVVANWTCVTSEGLTAAAEQHTGGMVALVPTEADAQRLAVDGYEPADVLHATLGFLGDGDALGPDVQAEVQRIAAELAANTAPIVANAHGVALFNAASDEPCCVYLLGDTDLLGPEGVPPLVALHGKLWADFDDSAALYETGGASTFPDQHSPWACHIAGAYSDDLSLLTEAGSDVTFDRLRVAFGDDVHDFPLAAGDTVVTSEEESMSVVTFTDEQRDEIRALSREGGLEALTSAQKLILSAVEAATTSATANDVSNVALAVGDEPAPDLPPVDAPTNDSVASEEFHILMVTEEQATLEKPSRFFAGGCFEWREPPFPLMWLATDTHSDGAPDPSVQVGLVTRVERQGLEIHGWGMWDDPVNEDAAEARRRVENGMLRWNSVDIGDVGESDIELVFPPPGTLAPDGIEVMEPEMVKFHHGRLTKSTLVFDPAQENAQIEPLIMADGMEPMPGELMPEEDMALAAAGYAVTIPDVPDASWFAKPPRELLRRGALTVTDEGRVYGLLAPGAVPHVGRMDRKTVPLRNVDYTDFLRGETPVRLADGKVGRVVTGNLTMACGHASTMLPNGATTEHYDNSCSLFATATCGEANGDVWVAGALLPGVDADQVRRAMACQLSGHWNPHELARGRYSLLAGLLVPIPGFPTGRSEATATTRWGPNDDGDLVMVASAVPVRFEQTAPASVPLSPVAERIAKSVGLDRATRAKALAARVKGV